MNNKDFLFKIPNCPSYTVTYGLYNEPAKYPWNSINNKFADFNINTLKQAPDLYVSADNACFYNLGSILRAHKNEAFNRIVYVFSPHESITKQESLRWLILAKQHKLLPRYANVKRIVESNNVIIDLSKTSFNLLYAYLATVRVLVEEPMYVKNSLVFIDKYKVNYYAAIVAAAYLGFRNFGHSFFCPKNNYPAVSNITTFNRLNLATILGVYRFIQQNGPDPIKDNTHFSATITVSSLSQSKRKIDVTKLANVDLTLVLNSKTDQEAEENLTKLLEANHA